MMRNNDLKRFFTVYAVALLLLVIAMVGTANAKSIYLVTDHHGGSFAAYNINPDGTVTFQYPITIPYHVLGPSGVALDWDSATLFITYERSNIVEFIDATTLASLGNAAAPGASDLAGIDVDDLNDIVYTVDRATNTLYAYQWDPVAKTLTLLAGYPIGLVNCQGAFGIALDEIIGILYVSDGWAGVVRGYNVSSWSEVTTFTPSMPPTGIAVDRRRGFVYTTTQDSHCAYGPYGYRLLSKYDLNTSTETTIDMGHGGMGVVVDEVTGYVYVTGGCSGDDLSVWDTSISPFTQKQTTGRIGNPAGIAIGNVSYNPLNLAKNDDVVGYGVYIGQTFTYEITYDNADNVSDVTNVRAVDTLPEELDYISSTPVGVYDPVEHTVTWDIGTLPTGYTGGLILLEVRVNQNAVGETTIYNYCTIESDQTPPTTVEGTDPDNPQPGEPGTYIHDFVFCANYKIIIRAQAPSEGDLFCNGRIKFNYGLPSTLTGDLTSAGNIRIQRDNTIDGNVTAAGEVENDGTVTGTITKYTTVDPKTMPTLSFSAGGNNETVPENGTLALAPGTYWTVKVHYNGRLELSSGEYFMEYLNVDKDAVVSMDVSGGPVTINVVQLISFGENSEVEIVPSGESGTSQVTFNNLNDGSLKIHLGAKILGSIIAPEAKVSINKYARFKGSICANIITTDVGVTFLHHGSSTSLPKAWSFAQEEKASTELHSMPAEYVLDQNYPNPFNPSTNISYAIPNAGDITLAIYNLKGQLIRTLVSGAIVAGQHKVVWDGKDARGIRVSSGIYVYRLEAQDFVANKKLVLTK